MPNKATHLRYGVPIDAAIGGFVDVCVQYHRIKQNPKTKFNWSELALSFFCGAGIAIIGSRIPDFLEPAKNPRHRKFFHSVAFASLVTTGTIGLAVSHVDPKIKVMGTALGGTIVGHIIQDSQTSFGVPFVS